MNIVSMSDNSLFDNPKVKYVGRSNYTPGLGNPWTHHTNARQARFYCSTPQAALEQFGYFILKEIVPHYVSGLGLVGLEDWKREYLSKLLRLSADIESGKYDSLGCWCINIGNYLPVPDGMEKCHAEIIYKGCLKLIEYKQGRIKK